MKVIVPPRYTPWANGAYEVSPGLKALTTDFGNGNMDHRHFQIDNDYARYVSNKQHLASKHSIQHVLRDRFDRATEARLADAIAQQLSTEYPTFFARSHSVLTCHLTGTQCDIREPRALDAIALMIQEDLAVVCRDQQNDWLAYLHVCSPSDWAPEAKIGGNFIATHAPVPGFERTNAVAARMVDSIINRGPLVRFVWSVVTDDRLNHHSEVPDGEDPARWHGRQFELGRFWVRVERQVTWGFPILDAALFTIRVSFVPDTDVLANSLLTDSLRTALLGMSAEARVYKGVNDQFHHLISLLTKDA